MESAACYIPGGAHPVHIGDLLDNGRYEVIHKLGHGGQATVWLCLDTQTLEWRAVKITYAWNSLERFNAELRFLELLLQDGGSLRDDAASHHIGVAHDHFWTEGPNGRHLCFVLPLFGPRIDRDQDRHPDVVDEMCLQMVEGLHFLHEIGVCHGDFRPENVLTRLSGLEKASREEMKKLVGEPTRVETPQTRLGACMPQYLVPAVSPDAFQAYETSDIAIVDFSASFDAAKPPVDTGVPPGWKAPEQIIDMGVRPGRATDVWALAVTMLGLQAHERLGHSDRQVLAETELLMGPLPEPLRSAWLAANGNAGRAPLIEADGEYADGNAHGVVLDSDPHPDDLPPTPPEVYYLAFDTVVISHARYLGCVAQRKAKTGYTDPLRANLGRRQYVRHAAIRKGDDDDDDDRRVLVCRPREEVDRLADLYRCMLAYDAGERYSTAEIIASPWFAERRNPLALITTPQGLASEPQSPTAAAAAAAEDADAPAAEGPVTAVALAGAVTALQLLPSLLIVVAIAVLLRLGPRLLRELRGPAGPDARGVFDMGALVVDDEPATNVTHQDPLLKWLTMETIGMSTIA